MIALAIHLGIGLGLGLLTSVPIGVANAAVIDAGLRWGRRRALAIAAGAAVADTLHSAAAFVGVGSLIDRHPLVPAILFTASGALITAYGIHAMRSPTRRAAGGFVAGGFAAGLVLTGLNPGALLAWIAVAGALAPPSALAGTITAAGVGLGAFACFAVLAHLAARRHDVGAARGTTLARWVSAALIALGAISIGRGVYLLGFG